MAFEIAERKLKLHTMADIYQVKRTTIIDRIIKSVFEMWKEYEELLL